MTAGDYVCGAATLVVVAGSWALAATRVRAWLCPDWHGPLARLAEAIVATAGLIVVCELLGLVGELRRAPVGLFSAGVAAVVAVADRRRVRPRRDRPASPPAYPRAALLLALGCAVMVLSLVVGASLAAVHSGPVDTDALHYHLTAAARFVQTGSLTELHRMSAGDGSAFYPFNAELLDAVAMLGPHPDIATLLVNPLFAVIALLGAWVLGDRYRVAPAAVAALAVVLATPLVVSASAGPGLNDVPALAFLVAAVAVLAHAGVGPDEEPVGVDRTGPRLAPLVLVGVALGLAAGTKLSMLAPVGLVAAGVVVAARGARARAAAAVVLAAAATGGFWYLRDWVLAGTPLPGVTLQVAGVGLPSVPMPDITPYAYTTAHYLGDPQVVRHWYVPDLRIDFGVLWPAFVAVPFAAAAVALARRVGVVARIVAVTVVGGFLAYLVTPTTAIGPPGQPVLFGSNVRYALPELALGLLLFAVVARGRARLTATCAVGAAVTAAYLLAVVGSSLRPSYRSDGLAIAVAVAAVLGALVVAVRRAARPALGAGAAVVGLLAVAVVGYPVQRRYLEQRYTAATPAAAEWTFTRSLRAANIAVIGFPLQYPLYGPTLDNRVQYVGVASAHHAYGDVVSCAAWHSALSAGRYDYVVVELTPNRDYRPFLHWTNGRVVAQDGPLTVLRLDASSPTRCT